MNINGVNNSSAVQKIVSNPIQRSIPADAANQLPATDKLELSGVSHFLSALKSNDVRVDKVADIRSQIDAGTYESDDKLNSALDGLLDDLNR